MDASDLPPRFPIPWGADASSPYIRPIPEVSQIGIQDGAASLQDGFPPLCGTPVPDGGVPPFEADMNGALNQITKWSQWQAAGGPVFYDTTFSSSIGGYPKGAIISSASAETLWYSTVDGNMNNPDVVITGWVPIYIGGGNAVSAFERRSEAISAIIPFGIQVLNIAGYSQPGDGGAATYIVSGSAPVAGGFTSADGQHWNIVGPFPFNLTQFGWQTGVDCHVAAQAALDRSYFNQKIVVPDGNTVCTVAVTSPHIVRWVGGGAVNMSLASAQNLFTGVNTPQNFPILESFGAFDMCNIGPGTQANYWTATTLDDGAVAADYENSAGFFLGGTFDPLNGALADMVGLNARGYVNAEGCRAYGLHVVALSQTGINTAGLVGQEIDVINHSTEINGYDPFQKIALALYAAGNKRSSRALEIGPAGSTFYTGIHINGSAIDSGSGSFAFQYDGKFAVTPDGTSMVGKDVSDRNDPGVEIHPDGSIYQSSSSTCIYISTLTGVVGAGPIAAFIAQQKNSAGTLKDMVTLTMSSSVVTAGAESSVFSFNGYIGGLPADLMEVSGARLGPGTDNTVAGANPFFRYTTIYLATNPVVSSDVALKDSIGAIPDAVLDAWGDVRYVRYKETDAVAKKGDGARWHYGLSAQDVVKAFENRGLDPWQHGALCRDKVFEQVKTTKTESRQKTVRKSIDKVSFAIVDGKMVQSVEPKIIDDPVTTTELVFNPDGSPTMEISREPAYEQNGKLATEVVTDPVTGRKSAKPLMRKTQRQVSRVVPVMEDVEVPSTEQRDTGTWRHSLRYTECHNIEAAWVRRESAKKDKMISDLSARLAQLEKAKS